MRGERRGESAVRTKMCLKTAKNMIKYNDRTIKRIYTGVEETRLWNKTNWSKK